MLWSVNFFVRAGDAVTSSHESCSLYFLPCLPAVALQAGESSHVHDPLPNWLFFFPWWIILILQICTQLMQCANSENVYLADCVLVANAYSMDCARNWVTFDFVCKLYIRAVVGWVFIFWMFLFSSWQSTDLFALLHSLPKHQLPDSDSWMASEFGCPMAEMPNGWDAHAWQHGMSGHSLVVRV